MNRQRKTEKKRTKQQEPQKRFFFYSANIHTLMLQTHGSNCVQSLWHGLAWHGINNAIEASCDSAKGLSTTSLCSMFYVVLPICMCVALAGEWMLCKVKRRDNRF